MNPLSTTLVNILPNINRRFCSPCFWTNPTNPNLKSWLSTQNIYEKFPHHFFHPTQNPPVTHHTKNHHQIRGESLRSCAPPLQVEVDFLVFSGKVGMVGIRGQGSFGGCFLLRKNRWDNQDTSFIRTEGRIAFKGKIYQTFRWFKKELPND